MSQEVPTPPEGYPIDLLAAGRLLGLGRKRLIKWSKEGRLPHVRVGFEWYFTEADLLHFATLYCLECGGDNLTIDEEVYFCPTCASAFTPDRESSEHEVQLLDRFVEQRLQLFFMRLESRDEAPTDEEATAAIQERFDFSPLRAYQLWFEHHHQKNGTIRVGLGDPDPDFEFFDEQQEDES